MRRWRGRVRTAGWLLLWTLLVCYPNPLVFFQNFLRYARFPVEPAILDRVSFSVPREPRRIEEAVKAGIPYEFDWRQYGVPWYVPAPAEVLRSGRGDCESRAVVLASLLHARGIPYRLQASLVHLWVDYPGKQPNAHENAEIAVMRREDGRLRFRVPDLVRLRDDFLAQKEALWEVMPAPRKWLLLGGWAAFLLLPRARRRRTAASDAVTSRAPGADILHGAPSQEPDSHCRPLTAGPEPPRLEPESPGPRRSSH